MKVIVAGSREFNDYEFLQDKLADVLRPLNEARIVPSLISGGARGADALAERFAHDHYYAIEVMPADWDKWGRQAGYRRNVEMARAGDVLVAFWDGESNGTKHMISIALDEGLDVHVYRYPRNERNTEVF